MVHAEAFLPDPRTAALRNDNGAEVSINWEDNAGVLGGTLAVKASSAFGVARISREAIDHENKTPGCNGALSYERHEVDGNEHHGNIVFRAGLSQVVTRMIATALAMNSYFLPRPETTQGDR